MAAWPPDCLALADRSCSVIVGVGFGVGRHLDYRVPVVSTVDLPSGYLGEAPDERPKGLRRATRT